MKTLDILILSLPDRLLNLKSLLDKLEKQIDEIGAKNFINIYYIGDNRKFTIVEKRNLLLKLSTSDYITYIDDDDLVSDCYVKEIFKSIQYGDDIIVFDVKVSDPDYLIKNVRYDIRFDWNLNFRDTFIRIPDYKCILKKEIYQKIGEFSNPKNYGEDYDFSMRLKELYKTNLTLTQKRINKFLYFYFPNYSIKNEYITFYNEEDLFKPNSDDLIDVINDIMNNGLNSKSYQERTQLHLEGKL